MNFAYEAYIGNYINAFRKATGIENLSQEAMHFYLFKHGVLKTRNGGYMKRELNALLKDGYFLNMIREGELAPKPGKIVITKHPELVQRSNDRLQTGAQIEENKRYYDSIQPYMPEADMKTVSEMLINEKNLG